ncbi:hypothetical protein SADUNF_Sadunf02G0164500 [Salix dunnii]|uniref:Uncharacterized protein n=1 Tax=Salix dunnii TaxID=1413687 RepID=A0A835N8M9_9ROSI|nr:hypothetical protein SADUNF_Sadunf02G0164500 [Salix dunnii]
MASIHSYFTTPGLLLSLLVIASVGRDGYDPKPDTFFKPDNSHVLESKPDAPDVTKPSYTSNPKLSLTKPKLTKPKPDKGYDSKPHLDKPIIPNLYTVKLNYGYDPKIDALKPEFTMPKPSYGYDSKPKLIVPIPDISEPYYKYDSKPNLPEPKMTAPKPGHGYDPKKKKGIEGRVLCKQGSDYTPIKLESKYLCYSFFTKVTFHLTLKVTKCQPRLESSPPETGNIPTDMNYGIRGDPFHLIALSMARK